MIFDCLVLSGGGAKGAYGAGAAKALAAYRLLKRIDHTICYFGASAGALNAAVLATTNADQLIRFWREATTRSILNVRIKDPRYQTVKRWAARMGRKRPFSVYTGDALLRLINETVKIGGLADKHLVVAATDYTEGGLRAFYHSDLITRFLDVDRGLEPRQQRLQHFLPLTEDNLASALLASSSIPVFFPPVPIGGNWYVDGGLGNNTPTREAAYFLRYLTDTKAGSPGEIYVVRLEPPRIRRPTELADGLLEIVDRSLSIYHHIHTSPILRAWNRINDEVRWHTARLEKTCAWVQELGLSEDISARICERLRMELGTLGGATPRLEVPMYIIEPSGHLGETLDFEQATIEKNLAIGYQDALKALHLAGKLDQAERDMLLDKKI